jgi:GTP-binding protein
VNKLTVAIIGRPNVGKSTLFNRILGGRKAIVSERPGTTRDRHFGDAEWAGHEFWLVDTGGLVPGSADSMDQAIRRQVDVAVEEADVIVLVVDGLEGLSPVDSEVAAQLRKAHRPVLLVVNKADDLPDTAAHLPFYELGLGEPYVVSAAIGKGSGDLLDRIVALFPETTPDPADMGIEVAVVGRPNAGKSSLVNKLLGEERHVVAPEAGTTRDAIDSAFRFKDTTLTFIDTAGLRKKARVSDDLEFYSTVRTERSIDRATVCILVVDAAIGLHTQDLRIATKAWDAGCGLIIIVNKWDLILEKDANTAKRGQDLLIEKAPFLKHVPFVYGSALTGQRVRKVLDLILEVSAARERRIPTAEVNRVLQDLLERNNPPQKPGAEVKILYGSQVGTEPPRFALICNRPDDIPEAYQRYLVNGFRRAWGFTGAPVRVSYRRKKGKVAKTDGRRTR